LLTSAEVVVACAFRLTEDPVDGTSVACAAVG
jgi:hypothetical protein